MPKFGVDHCLHKVGHGPHAFTDLRFTAETAVKTGVDVPVLVGIDPELALHGRFSDHGTGFHAGVDFVTGTIKESRVDEHHTFGGAADAFRKVHGCATLLIHNAYFEGVSWQSECVLNRGKQVDRHADFIGSVHLRLHDVHGAGAGVAAFTGASEVVKRASCSEQRIHDALEDFVALAI